ncbi:MAG TPA: tRNA lysidine(34) synthetase TilS [Thauera sp.]|nr:tRNA lysidine(34) synthetase TilS [Rhodoferax sp.]HQX61322.1 tRNA lysidine(34) synthetase TilS [Burkholderiaceae bacterium]HQZ06731.1 tRNA lysidine(34) synthetase TilS [Burkholderiaceae bacterium]HRA82501.1 tRNA lysidine(34) synthetase TilS [Thauera sp.]
MSTRSLPDAVAAFEPELPLAVALSGGADSTALLLACARRWPGEVVAIHVHHGLQAAADDFERHCAALCRDISVPLRVRHVDARHAAGESPEDAARMARYRAIDAAVRSDDGGILFPAVALAQHADDQVETMLLALSRGAGLPGLAAMPRRRVRHGVVFHRPLLDVSAASIRTWLKAQGVAHVDDPTNADEALTRNRIRARLLPALELAFPQFRETFSRSARHAAQAQQLLDALAAEDLLRVKTAAGVSIAALQAMDGARQANLLRHWLRLAHGVSASAAQLRELQQQISACTTRGHQIRIKVAGGFVVRSAADLSWYNGRPDSTLTG